MGRVTRATIDEFMGQEALAVVGVSRRRAKFGNVVYRTLRESGYRVRAVNPAVEEIEGDRCWPSVGALPEPVGGAVIVVPPERAEAVVGECAEAGIPRVWLQPGAQSDAAIRKATERGLAVVHGECVLMYAEPAGWVHRLHRGIRRMLGRMPR